MKPFLSLSPRATGRPPLADLTENDLKEIKSIFIAGTNPNKKDGSILRAWVLFCEANADRFGHLTSDHMPATTIPTAVVEACRQTRALIAAHRGGAARQRHEGASVPGTMRVHAHDRRRLLAGERASVDDATRNTACWIPWPWGGCPCSEKFGVRLGRWQTLIVHDDATSYIPFISSVFRWHQSYRATDAASVIFRAEKEVVMFDSWSIEGGVWQAKRTLAVLGGRFISAKGRPNQKLVENAIGRLWGIMAGQPGDVGRHRAEMKSASELYVKCRAGLADPRKHFLGLDQAQEQLYSSVQYLNEKRLESRLYGKWVPQARWESDLTKHPRPARDSADDFLIQPAAETATIRQGSFRKTLDGPMGMPYIFTFAADWLWQFEGRKLTAYFDPMAEWPVSATFTLPDSRKPLGQAECINTFGESKDRAAEIVKSIRQTMMSETRNLSTRFTERQIRHNQGVIVVQNPAPHVPAIQLDRLETTPIVSSPTLRDAAATPPRITREDLSSSLGRRAKIARQTSIKI